MQVVKHKAGPDEQLPDLFICRLRFSVFVRAQLPQQMPLEQRVHYLQAGHQGSSLILVGRAEGGGFGGAFRRILLNI